LTKSNEEWMVPELARLGEQGLRRRLSPLASAGGVLHVGGRRVLNFCSNDYLGLSRHPHVVARAAEALREYGAGATASRLLAGTLELHGILEKRLADFKGYPSALVFGSGFLANLGVVDALVGKGDCVFADRLIHASLIDAIKLSGAKLRRFRHNDASHLGSLLATHAGGRRLVVTESVFSMDGDRAPLADIAQTAGGADAMLMVDEAHSCAILPPSPATGDAVNISMGTLSKAFGGYGGFICCSPTMREWLVNRARAFIYTTGLPPACLGSALGVLDVLHDDPEMGDRLLRRSGEFRTELRAAGLDTGSSQSQIVPVMVGDNGKALSFARRLRESGTHCAAIRPPTVPPGTARIRFSLSLAHTPEDLRTAAKLVIAGAIEEGLL
jgi:8-amino-7-oxononanoate synthase